ncbi:MAG: Na/Pi cotransporter family protein [Bacilli bacterium]|nr:Na/Pi cotransporter family protein [Bacilli bacterium]
MDIRLELIPLIALIIGGLALFLYGITSISSELKVLADGDRFRRIISRATSNRVKSCAIGTGFTALIQSSGGTYALSIGLVKAGALEYKNAIAIVIGANLGTCITSFLISIPGISQFMPIVAFIAAFVMMVVHNRKAQQWSKIAFSLSLIFFGIWLMEFFIKNGVAKEQWFSDLMVFLNNYPWLGLLFGTAVTLVLQSCSAVIGVVQGVFAAAIVSGSPLTLFGILPIVIGSNIGAMIPSILSAFGGNAMGKRVALVNGFMKVTAGLLFMGLLYAVAPFLNSLSATEYTAKLQIALFHLIFNLTSVVIFLPLVRPMAWASEKIFPDKSGVGKKIGFKELDPKVIKTFPATGIALAKDLSDKMFGYVLTMFKKLDVYYKKGYNEDLKTYILELERATDNIDRHLADFLLNAETGDLSRRDLRRHGRIMRGIKDIERIGDYGQSLLTFYTNIYEKKNKFDEDQLKEINNAHKMALDLITKTLDVYENSDKSLALKVIKQRRDYNKKLDDYQEAYFKRTSSKKGETNNYISLIYVDILNSYERVYSHCANIAKLYNNDKDIDRYSKDDKTKFTNMSMRY